MGPLTIEDLLPLEEYSGRRREFFEAQARYLDRYRRVRIGPRATLLFENRQTLWFRVQELLRISRLTEPRLVQQELNLYNRLLPGRNRLQAAFLIHGEEEGDRFAISTPGSALRGEQLRLCLDTHTIPADLLTCRPEDRCAGTEYWVQFAFDASTRQLLASNGLSAYFDLDVEGLTGRSLPLSDEIRESLLEDLMLSDRDPD